MVMPKRLKLSAEYLELVTRIGVDQDYFNSWCGALAVIQLEELYADSHAFVESYQEYLYSRWLPRHATQIIECSDPARVLGINDLVEEWNSLPNKTEQLFLEQFDHRIREQVYGVFLTEQIEDHIREQSR